MKKTLFRAVTLFSAIASAYAGAQTQADIQLWDSTWEQYKALEAIPLPVRGYVTATSELTVVIKAPLEQVYCIYSNVNNALGLHPFLKSITPIRRFEAHHVPTYDFIAYEDIPMADGTIFHGVTVAQQRFHEEQNYYDADSFDIPGIVTHQHITFAHAKGGGTEVTEHLTFEAPPAYIDLTQQGGAYAHYLVQQGLKAEIESGVFKHQRCGCEGHDEGHGHGEGHGDDRH